MEEYVIVPVSFDWKTGINEKKLAKFVTLLGEGVQPVQVETECDSYDFLLSPDIDKLQTTFGEMALAWIHNVLSEGDDNFTYVDYKRSKGMEIYTINEEQIRSIIDMMSS